MTWPWRAVLILALVLTLLSWALAQVGVALGGHFIPPGPGYPSADEHLPDLFRFDAVYYRWIAETGYSFSGSVSESTNLVFAPLFPIIVRVISEYTNFSFIDAGFLLNKFLLVGSVFFWLLFLSKAFDARTAILCVFAMLTSVGLYALNGYYSEPSFLFFFGLCCWAHVSQRWALVAFSCAALGASRLTAFPVVAVFAAGFVIRAARSRGDIKTVRRNFLLASVCLSGTMLYLGYIQFAFGDPFRLLPAIQKSAWGRFHGDTSWLKLLSGKYLFDYLAGAFTRGADTVLDSRTINLFWMVTGLIASVHLLLKYRDRLISWAFASYMLMIYWSDASSEYLVSSHRFIAILPPTFVFHSDMLDWIGKRINRPVALIGTGLLALVNVAFGLFMTAMFNQGKWPYF
jgi:hypothetical protein